MSLRRSSRFPRERPRRGVVPPPRLLAAGLFAGLAIVALPLARPAAAAGVLYTLATQCSLQGAAPVACQVEAVDEGGATLYRHRIGSITETIRISADPVTMAIWSRDAKEWRPLQGASARFSTNTVCFNGKQLCVVNPNYLNSVREDRANTRLQGRDLVMVHFGKDGRVDASCYDDACALLLK